MLMIAALTTRAAQVPSAATLARAAAGVGIVLAAAVGAGAAGVLPAGLQDVVAGAVEAVSPFDLPNADDRASDGGSAVDSRRDPGAFGATGGDTYGSYGPAGSGD